MHDGLNSRSFSLSSVLVLVAVAAVAAYLLASDRLVDAAVLAGLVVLALLFISQRKRLPAVFSLLFVIAALVNSAGYLFNLWKTPFWFDEAVHFYTSFTVMAALGWLLFDRREAISGRGAGRFVASIVGLGTVLGLLWEVFEWIIGIIGTPVDTTVDVLMDTLGAIAAGLFCAWARGRSSRHAAAPVPAH